MPCRNTSPPAEPVPHAVSIRWCLVSREGGSPIADRYFVYSFEHDRRRDQEEEPAGTAFIVFDALTEPDRPSGRQWLRLLAEEIRPQVLESDEPGLMVWAAIWPKRPDAVIRFDLPSSGGGTDLRWPLSVEEPVPDYALVGHLCKRLNQLINAELPYSFGQWFAQPIGDPQPARS